MMIKEGKYWTVFPNIGQYLTNSGAWYAQFKSDKCF